MIIFDTGRLSVRHFTEADFETLYTINSDPDVMKHIRAPMTKEAVRELLDHVLDCYTVEPHLGRFAVIEKSSGNYIGNFVLRPSDAVNGIELGYAFSRSYWGLGYATELAIGGLEFAFRKKKLKKVYAITDTENHASQQVLIKAGFSQLDDITDKGRRLCLFRIYAPEKENQ